MTTLTGRAAFLPFALPTVDEEDIADVVDVLRSGWLTSGPRIQDLEREFAAQATAPAALALNSGTAAMHGRTESKHTIHGFVRPRRQAPRGG